MGGAARVYVCARVCVCLAPLSLSLSLSLSVCVVWGGLMQPAESRNTPPLQMDHRLYRTCAWRVDLQYCTFGVAGCLAGTARTRRGRAGISATSGRSTARAAISDVTHPAVVTRCGTQPVQVEVDRSPYFFSPSAARSFWRKAPS